MRIERLTDKQINEIYRRVDEKLWNRRDQAYRTDEYFTLSAIKGRLELAQCKRLREDKRNGFK